MDKQHVLLLETISDGAMAMLGKATIVHEAPGPDQGQSIAGRHPIAAIFTRGKGQVDRALIEACPHLKIIARAGVGLDNVDVELATEKGIMVINAPGSNAATVAEHTLGLLLSLQRKLYEGIHAVKNENWAYRHHYQGDELRGKTIGILGRGNIGTRVATLAEAFSMKVLYLARTRVQFEDLKSNERNLHELMAEADILSLHLPLTDRTRNLLNEKSLEYCKPGSLIINTARGEIVDHKALLRALKSGQVGGYAADVMSNEQRDKAGDLFAQPNVLITPHMASLTARTFTDMCEVTTRNLLAVLEGKSIPDRYHFNR